MSDSYVFGTGPVATGTPASQARYPLDFSKVAMLGNAGGKLNQLIYGDLLDSTVTDKPPGSLAPGGSIKATTPLSARNPRGLAQKILLATIGEVNPSGAELLPYQLPDGRILTPEQWAAFHEGSGPAQTLPMYLADP